MVIQYVPLSNYIPDGQRMPNASMAQLEGEAVASCEQRKYSISLVILFGLSFAVFIIFTPEWLQYTLYNAWDSSFILNWRGFTIVTEG